MLMLQEGPSKTDFVVDKALLSQSGLVDRMRTKATVQAKF